MKKAIWYLLTVVGLAICAVFTIIGFYGEIAEPAGIERLLKKLHIPFGYNFYSGVLMLAVIAVVILLWVRKKFR